MARDANDILQEEGPDGLRSVIDRRLVDALGPRRPVETNDMPPWLPEPGDPLERPNLDAVPLRLAEWLERDLPEADYLLGFWLTKTSRVLLVGATGLGKTNFLMALGMAIAAGIAFLHWRGHRPRRVLYIDGEMSRRLLKQRLRDAVRRLGAEPEGFCALSREDVPEMVPLNTPEGQHFIDALLERHGPFDLIIFDNIQALQIGDMKDEAPWQETLPWIRDLTRRGIAQIWAHHTGHDEGRSYGTKTREWQLDTCILLEKGDSGADLEFKLKFTKARERTPDTRHDFEPAVLALVDDQWTSDLRAKAPGKQPSPLGAKFLEALINALAESGQRRGGPHATVTMEQWRSECVRKGLLDRPGDRPNTGRALFSKYRLELIERGHICCDHDLVWVDK